MKRTLTVLLAVLMLLALATPALAGEIEAYSTRHPFTDVPAHHEAAVQFLWERGIMQGTSSTQFSPNSNLTRAMVATILHRVAGEPQTNFRDIFTDVSSGRWYSVAVTWAHENNVVNGVSSTRFAPQNNLTREQLAAMMYRYAVSRGYNVSVPANVQTPEFTSTWAVEYVRWATHHGFLSNFQPHTQAPRWEVATFVHRFMLHYGLAQPIGDIDTLTQNGATWRDLHNAGFTVRQIQDAFNREMIRLVNNYRREHGLSMFTANTTVTDVARARAEESLVNHSFTHISEATGLRDTAHFNRVTGLSVWFAGENLGAGNESPLTAFNAMMNSPDHRNFIMSGHHSAGNWSGFTQINQIGVGFATDVNQPAGDNHTRWAVWLMAETW